MKGFFKSILVLSLVLAGVAALMPAKADAAYAVKQVWSRFSCTAGEALVIGDVVMIKDSDGKCYKADADTATLMPPVGVAGTIAAASASVEVVTSGRLSGWTSLAEGGPAYLSTTAGGVTQTPSRYRVGFAPTTTEYIFSFSDAASSGMGTYGLYTAPSVSTTFTLADCGKTVGVATDALTHVLPNSTEGCCFTFTNTGAAGNNVIKIDVDADDQIFGTVTLAASVVAIAGSAGDSISLTKATSIRGDSITLCGVGSNVYNIMSSTGIWADTN